MMLSQNKLTGENFTNRKCNLNIVLTSEKHKFVLLETCLLEPAANTGNVVRDVYEKWIVFENMTCFYMLALMFNVLQQQHQGM